MRLPIRLDQLRGVDVGVALRRAQARVAEQLLNRAQIGAALEQVRRERVPQRVRADAEARAARRHVPPHQPVDAARRQPRRPDSSGTAGSRRDRDSAVRPDVSTPFDRVAARRARRTPSREPGRRAEPVELPPQSASHARSAASVVRLNGTIRSFRPFPSTRTTRPLRVDVVEVEPDQLAQAQPRRVEQLQDRAVAAAERQRRVGHLEQLRHLRLAEVRREALLALRRADERRRIALDHALAPQVAAERPDRRELSRRRRLASCRACAGRRGSARIC